MRNFLLLVFLLLSPFALGVRNLMVYTLKSTATAFQSGGADTARLVRVDCENLSSVAQHVKMTLRRQVAYLTLCIENTLGLSGKGAVLCGISASAVLGGAMNPQNSLITQPINGGRPF